MRLAPVWAAATPRARSLRKKRGSNDVVLIKSGDDAANIKGGDHYTGMRGQSNPGQRIYLTSIIYSC